MPPEAFWNRSLELDRIRRELGKGGFGYATGRRRVGKTALLKNACELHGGLYHQAVEGTPRQQLVHLAEEIRDSLPLFHDVVPDSWAGFFRLLTRERLPRLIVFDEFPYWAEADPTLPSLLQKWADHELPKTRSLLLVSGSSQAMLHSHFLNHSSPLYGRACLHLHLEPLSYGWFCKATRLDPKDPESFMRFSLVGGVPYYWKLMPGGSLLEQAQALYFEPSAILSQEPTHLLRDEGIAGGLPKAILDFVGRGVRRPSELAGRLGMAQGNLSRPLALLLELGLLRRELPFGESLRTTKKVLYSLQDPALSFYYGVYLPHRESWSALGAGPKRSLLRRHASRCWENHCRGSFPRSGRYWEGDVEIDLVAPVGEGRRLLVAECKWKALRTGEEEALLGALRERFSRTRLGRKNPDAVFRILSQKDLGLDAIARNL